MKNYSWVVEVIDPMNFDRSLWYCSDNTLEAICETWKKETRNEFINYYKLHNIHHKKNVSQNSLIKVKKIKTS